MPGILQPSGGSVKLPRGGGPPRHDPCPGEAGSPAPRWLGDGGIQPHGARNRQRRRRRHLRHDRDRRRPVRRPRRSHLVRAGRDRRRPHGDLLRGARRDDPDRRFDLLICLRRIRRVHGLVHRLGPAARVPVRGIDGRRRLVRLRRQPARLAWHTRAARPRQPPVRERQRHREPAGARRRRGNDPAAGGRHASVGRRQQRDRRAQDRCSAAVRRGRRGGRRYRQLVAVRAVERRRLRRLRRLGDHPRRGRRLLRVRRFRRRIDGGGRVAQPTAHGADRTAGDGADLDPAVCGDRARPDRHRAVREARRRRPALGGGPDRGVRGSTGWTRRSAWPLWWGSSRPRS